MCVCKAMAYILLVEVSAGGVEGPSNSRKDSNFKDYTSTEVPLRLKKQYTQRQHLNGNVVALMVVEVNCRCWLRGRGRRESVTRQDSSKDSKFKTKYWLILSRDQ